MESFHEKYTEIYELRALLTSGTPYCVLTASTTSEARGVLSEGLEMLNAVYTEYTPVKDNIKYSIMAAPTRDLVETFAWVLEELKKTINCTKLVINCRRRTDVKVLFRHFQTGLGEKEYALNPEGTTMVQV